MQTFKIEIVVKTVNDPKNGSWFLTAIDELLEPDQDEQIISYQLTEITNIEG
jgi:hypothetical protein